MRKSDDRVAANVDIFCGKDQIGGGRTAGPTQDMNDVLEFMVEKNKVYTLNYFDKNGQWVGEEEAQMACIRSLGSAFPASARNQERSSSFG